MKLRNEVYQFDQVGLVKLHGKKITGFFVGDLIQYRGKLLLLFEIECIGPVTTFN